MVEMAAFTNELTTFATGFLGNILEGVAAFAIVVIALIVGHVVAWLINSGIRKFLKHLSLEAELKKHHLHDSLLGFTFTQVITTLMWLWVMVLFFGFGAGVMKFPFLMSLASMATNYLPSLTSGAVVLVAGLMIGDYITDRMKLAKGVPFVNLIAIVVEVFIAYNALVIALPMLLPRASTVLLEQSFAIVLAALGLMLGLGGAIAIGLGLKDTVAKVADKNKDKFNIL
jgi:membrane protein YqaA with SNARE-associated domain